MPPEPKAVSAMVILTFSGELRKFGIPVIEEGGIAASAHNPNNLCDSKRWVYCGLPRKNPPLAGLFDRKDCSKEFLRVAGTTRLLTSRLGILKL